MSSTVFSAALMSLNSEGTTFRRSTAISRCVSLCVLCVSVCVSPSVSVGLCRRVREQEFDVIRPTPINIFGGEAVDQKSKPKQRRITRAARRQANIAKGWSGVVAVIWRPQPNLLVRLQVLVVCRCLA